METQALTRELKRGSTELLILALLEERRRHGYEIAQLIDERSHGLICFHAASLYPTLYRLERRGLIDGCWVEKAGQRRRRYYRLTSAGRKALASQRSLWEGHGVAHGRMNSCIWPAAPPASRRSWQPSCSSRPASLSGFLLDGP